MGSAADDKANMRSWISRSVPKPTMKDTGTGGPVTRISPDSTLPRTGGSVRGEGTQPMSKPHRQPLGPAVTPMGAVKGDLTDFPWDGGGSNTVSQPGR